MRLQGKVSLFFGGLFLLIIIQGIFFITHDRRIFQREMADTGRLLAENLAEISRESIASYQFSRLLSQVESIRNKSDVEYISIVNENNLVLADTRSQYEGWIFSGELVRETVIDQNRSTMLVRAPVFILGTLRGNVDIAFSLDGLNQKIKENILVYLLFIIFEVAAAILFILVIEMQLVRPLDQLAAKVTDINPKELQEPIILPRSSSIEITRVSGAIDQMKNNLKRAQDEIISKTKMATMGKIAASFAHEIRNPLEAISGSVEVLSYDIEEKAPGFEYIAIIREEIKNLNGYLENFLEFSKTQPVHRVRTRLNQVIEDTLLLLRPLCLKKKITCIRKYYPELEDCYADPWLIKRVCMNLLLNSIEAFDEKNETAEKRVELETANSGSGFVQLIIRDNGIGIASEHLDNIFDPYYTTKASGSGIGLPVCRQIVEQHDGILTISSPLNGEGVQDEGAQDRNGTEVRLMLPVFALTANE